MKIVFDSHIFGIQRVGGISRYVVELAEALRNIDSVDARILAPLHVNRLLAASKAPRIGVSLETQKLRPGIRSRLDRAISALSLSAMSSDILHTTYYLRHSKPRSSKALVVTVHDMIHELMPSCFSESDPTVMLKRKAIEAADHVICVSENTRRDLCRLLDIDVARTSVVHHGVRLRNHSSTAPYDATRPYLLYVGQRGGYKNFELLVRAYANTAARRAGLNLIAFGGGIFTARELQLLEAVGLADGSVFQISGDDDQLDALYVGASAFVYPSLYEGFGMPVLEAMALGCPVIAANSSSIPEAGGNAAEYFDPSSRDDLVRAIDTLVSSPSLTQSLREKGYQRAKVYSWEKAAAETLDVYRSVLSARAAA